MTPEQKQQRIEQILERQNLNLPAVERLNPEYAEAVRDIDFLLSLVKSQEAGNEDTNRLAFAIESAAVKAGILKGDQPVTLTCSQLLFLCDDLANAATSTRSACVEKVKKKASSYQADADNKSLLPNYRKQMAFAASALREAANELESVTLQEQEAKQS